MDPEHRLVVSGVAGERTLENVSTRVEDVRERTAGRIMSLMTSAEYAAYQTVILETYGETVTPEPTGKPGRPTAPYQVPPPS